jgi:hypothetical protein
MIVTIASAKFNIEQYDRFMKRDIKRESIQTFKYTVEKYERYMKNDIQRKHMKSYLSGLGIGFHVANKALTNRKELKYYCLPDKLTLSEDDYTSIINKYIETMDEAFKKKMYIEPILFWSLVDKFPCKKTGGKS